jgi:hypothetical protein
MYILQSNLSQLIDKHPMKWNSNHARSVAWNLICLSILMTRLKVASTHECCRVLGSSAHIKSRALVSQSAPVAFCCLSLSLCAPPADTSDSHERRWPNFGRFCAFKVTCSRQVDKLNRFAVYCASICVPAVFVCAGHISGFKKISWSMKEAKKSKSTG